MKLGMVFNNSKLFIIGEIGLSGLTLLWFFFERRLKQRFYVVFLPALLRT